MLCNWWKLYKWMHAYRSRPAENSSHLCNTKIKSYVSEQKTII